MCRQRQTLGWGSQKGRRKRIWGSKGSRALSQQRCSRPALPGSRAGSPPCHGGTHVVGQPADPAGEAFRVRLQPALPVPRRGHPAVVNADELVAGVPPAVGDHPVRHLHEQLLAAGKKAENV